MKGFRLGRGNTWAEVNNLGFRWARDWAVFALESVVTMVPLPLSPAGARSLHTSNLSSVCGGRGKKGTAFHGRKFLPSLALPPC